MGGGTVEPSPGPVLRRHPAVGAVVVGVVVVGVVVVGAVVVLDGVGRVVTTVPRTSTLGFAVPVLRPKSA